MMKFGVKKSSNGKKSRLYKKFPRKKIAKVGKKAIYWYGDNWNAGICSYLSGNLHRFLLSNVGRPVDKVFSEFLQRCRKGTEKYNLKERFYDMFEEKENIDYRGGFYLSNGILNHKKRTKRPKPKSCSYTCIGDYNRAAMPNIALLCRQCEVSHLKQLLGEFKLTYNVQKRVYIVEREVWLSDYKLQAHYKLCSIYGVGKGVQKNRWTYGKDTYEVWDNWSWSKLPEFVFITKAN